MRRLGKELGVEAMSLYGYVANKQDLLEGVLARVYEEMPRCGAGTWEERLRAIARRLRHVLLRHPNVVCLVAARPIAGEGGLHMVESALAELRDGLGLVNAHRALTVVMGLGGVGEPRRPDDSERFPNVSALSVDHDAEFEVGLDVIVAGVSRLMDLVV